MQCPLGLRRLAAAVVSTVSCVCAAWANSPPSVSIVSAAQRTDGSRVVDIYYDLMDADAEVCKVSVEFSDDGGSSWATVVNLSGDAGPGVWPGEHLHIAWLAGTDLPDRQLPACRVRVCAADNQGPTADLVYIPGGTFQMGDSVGGGDTDEVPVHVVYVSGFYIGMYEVSKGQWDVVRNWALLNGYEIPEAVGKATSHPVNDVSWNSAVKWCNARSEKEGRRPCYYQDAEFTIVHRSGEDAPYVDWTANGYRMPTEAEWEKAARGGAEGQRFPWADASTIQHTRANYYSSTDLAYDTSPTRGYHPDFNDGVMPYTSPVGTFAPNGYGVYDASGNVWEWCHDQFSRSYYQEYMSAGSLPDPVGPANGSGRTVRGGSWPDGAVECRVANRTWAYADGQGASNFGFRCVMRETGGVRQTSCDETPSFNLDTRVWNLYGMAIPTWWHEDYKVDAAPGFVPYLPRTLDWIESSAAIRAIELCPAWFMDSPSDWSNPNDPNGTRIYARYRANYDEQPFTPNDEDLKALIREVVEQRHCEVVLKPHIDAWDSNSGAYTLDRKQISPANLAAWFASYEAFICHYATLAHELESEGVSISLFCIGTELAGTHGLDGTASWHNVIQAIRATGYDGPLTYAANWDEYDEVGVYRWLDVIGIDAYFPLEDPDYFVDPNTPTKGELVAAWKPYVIALRDFSVNTVGKPVVFMELGYPATPGANKEPWRTATAAEGVDYELQKRCYEAAISVWRHKKFSPEIPMSWFGGVIWWGCSAETSRDLGGAYQLTDCLTNGFSTYNKSAAATLGIAPGEIVNCVEIQLDHPATVPVSVPDAAGFATFRVRFGENDSSGGSVHLTVLDPYGVTFESGAVIPNGAYVFEHWLDERREEYRVVEPASGTWGVYVTQSGMRTEPQCVTIQVETAPPDTDTDGDGIPDVIDSCPLMPNVEQADIGLDGLGDACQSDFDGSGAVDATDLDLFDACWGGPGLPPAGTDPDVAGRCDFDGDGDVDLFDLRALQWYAGTATVTP